MTLSLTLDVSAVPARPAGAGRYVFELARHLATSDQVQTHVIARNEDADRWESLTPKDKPLNVHAVAPQVRPLRLLWEQARLPKVIAQLGADVHHAPHYTMPERSKVPTVVTIHDMTFFTNPELHERSKVLVFRRAIKVAVKRADHLIAVSNDTAQRVREHFGDVPITVIPHGIDHRRFTNFRNITEPKMLAGYGVPPNYIAFVGTIEPRKNLPRLIAAFDLLAEKHPDLSLIIAGQRGWQLEEFDNAVASAKHRRRIRVLGYVSEGLVPMLLRHAKVVAYPSLVEGFGLPALEAMACGTPVVVGKGSAMSEVAKDVGIFVEQDDVDSLREGLERAMESNGAPGVEVAKKFSWEAAIDAHIDVYKKVCGK